MCEGLILAAGKSQRTKKHYKMELKFNDKTIIEKSIDSMYPFCSRIILVTGYNAERLSNLLKGYEKLEIIFNPDYELGMYASIKEGLKHINSGRFFLLPGDCPLINSNVYKSLLKVDSEIVIPTYNKIPGHPVLLKNTLIKEILSSQSYSSLKEFIISKNPIYLEVNCKGILLDIDTIEDYYKALNLIDY